MKKLLILLLLPFIGRAQVGITPGFLFVGASGFSPVDISGLKLWVKADDLEGYLDGDPVGTWPDVSGVGNDLTSSSTARPVFKTAIQNGLSILRFDGSNDVMSKASFSGVDGVSGMTVFLIVKQASLSTNQVYVSKWDYATQGSWAFQTGDGSSSEVTAYIADNIIDAGVNHNQSSGAGITSAFYLIEMVYDGSQGTAADRVKFYVNGVLQTNSASGTLPTSLTTCTADFRVGQFGGALTRNYNGDFGEILVYNSALGSTNRGLVETYLNAKWAVY
jgi:hypothetical protein